MTKELIKKEKKTEITASNSLSPESLIEKALTNNVAVETIEKLLAMRRELKAEFAKEQFDLAMANFQSECPVIEKRKNGATTGGKVAYKYAPLESIVQQTKEVIGRNGLSYQIKIETGKELVKAICIVKHISGHSESSEMEGPHGVKTGIMSNTQVYAATSTFLKRYAFCNAFGIMTGDVDNDAQYKDIPQTNNDNASKLLNRNIPAEKFINEGEIVKIKGIILEAGSKKEDIEKHYNKELKDFTETEAEDLKKKLNLKIEALKKIEKETPVIETEVEIKTVPEDVCGYLNYIEGINDNALPNDIVELKKDCNSGKFQGIIAYPNLQKELIKFRETDDYKSPKAEITKKEEEIIIEVPEKTNEK